MRRRIAHICVIAQSIYVTDKPMQVRIFTIAFDPRQESFPDEERCAFFYTTSSWSRWCTASP